jgi:DMSO reductase anchor subunit
MSQRLAVAARKRRRMITYAWVAGLALITILLIYKEQTALLYILATLSVTALLVVVAVADLHGNEPATVDTSPSAGGESTVSSRSSTARRR